MTIFYKVCWRVLDEPDVCMSAGGRRFETADEALASARDDQDKGGHRRLCHGVAAVSEDGAGEVVHTCDGRRVRLGETVKAVGPERAKVEAAHGAD